MVDAVVESTTATSETNVHPQEEAKDARATEQIAESELGLRV